MKAWLQLISIGMVGGLVATSCVITSDDDDDDDGFGDAGETSTGGRTPTGGRTSGGTNTGGASGGTTGGTSTGGAAPSGGMGGEGGAPVDVCEAETTPLDTCEFEDADECASCLSESCCDEVSACYGTDPEDVCGYGLSGEADENSEFECTRSCLAEIVAEGNFVIDDDIDDCLAQCMKCTLPSLTTTSLVACMNDNCPDECYE